MSPKLPILFIFSLLMILAPTAQAQEESDAMLFEDIDSNHNGAITREEAKVRKDLARDFDEADTNGNGTISVDEYTTYHNKGQLVPEEVEIPEPGAAPIR